METIMGRYESIAEMNENLKKMIAEFEGEKEVKKIAVVCKCKEII